MKFEEIPGQFNLKNELINTFNNKKIPHSLLITGEYGFGSLAIAYAFASYIQCNDRSESDKCGICPACKKTDKLIHPDIGFTFPILNLDKKPKSSIDFIAEWRDYFIVNKFGDLNDWLGSIGAEGKNANINKASIEDISSFFTNSVYEGNKKIMIVWCAELIGHEGNRLLKLIEEPPPNSLIILVTNDLNQILKTIQSRCRIFRIPPIADEEIFKYLKVKNIEEDSVSSQLVKTADGNLNQLEKLLESEQNDLFEIFLRWLNISYQGNSEKMLSISEEFSRFGKENLKKYFAYLLFFLEQVIISFSLDDQILKLNDKEIEAKEKLKKLISKDKTIKFVELIENNIQKINRNANLKLMIFDSSIKLNKIFKSI